MEKRKLLVLKAMQIGALALLFQLAIPSLIPSLVFASQAGLKAFGNDTVAGYGTILQSSAIDQTSAMGQQPEVTFRLTKPDGTVLYLPAKTDLGGIAKTDLPDYHTRLAGVYFLSVTSGGQSAETSSFMVYPDKIDEAKSTLSVKRTIAKANGIDQAAATVQLLDRFGNVLAGHQVHLLSSRATDKITANIFSNLTDKNGVITFSISSNKAGVSTFSAMDVTTNTTLASRAQIAFISADRFLADIGGDFGFADVAMAASSAISRFEFSNLPASVQPGQSVGFKITAMDDTSAVVSNYTGKIHFSAEGNNGNNVTLPEDYTFKADDLGVHQFSLGLSFTTAGIYKLAVNDLDNPLIKGSKEVTVGTAAGSNGSAGSSADQGASSVKPVIQTPVSGTYSQKTQTISGTAPAGMTVKIFDNEQEITQVAASANGVFTFQTGPLSDGVHKIYVTTLDSSKVLKSTSDTVQITIDSAGPTVEDVKILPNTTVKPGQVLTLNLKSEENLSQAAIVFNADITQLNPALDKPGFYTASFQAPNAVGVYPLDFVLVDQLGNEGSFKAKAQITVSTDTAAEMGTGMGAGMNAGTGAGTGGPTKVSGLLSYASDKKVTLVWDSATDGSMGGMVKHYRVYYGTDASKLDQHADTKDAATSWYIPNLENGREYYFAVTAFNDKGAESPAKSEVITGTPFVSELAALTPPPDNFANPQGYDSFENLHPTYDAGVPPLVNKTGPEILWVLSGAGLIASIRQKLRRKNRK